MRYMFWHSNYLVTTDFKLIKSGIREVGVVDPSILLEKEKI